MTIAPPRPNGLDLGMEPVPTRGAVARAVRMGSAEGGVKPYETRRLV